MERMACEHNSDARVDFRIDSCAVRLKQVFGPELYRHLAPRLMTSWARTLEHLQDRGHVKPAIQAQSRALACKECDERALQHAIRWKFIRFSKKIRRCLNHSSYFSKIIHSLSSNRRPIRAADSTMECMILEKYDEWFKN